MDEADKEIQQNKNKEAVKQDAKGLWESLKSFVVELLDFRADTDREVTIEHIKSDIPFKGATAWILICSIFVASIGLNANSTAVVIGAMLISPLMGPILGIGMSIAINDIFTLKKSFINFGVMILLSVLTAFLFFWLFPLREESSELLARTKPDIRDVLIAFFGGLALIIARTKKGTIASVIFGVAIATALMPPLCTVGYGLAEAFIGNEKGLGFAGGAMYLFLINTVFIALATFIVLKVLRFPMIRYANSKRRKNIARLTSIVAFLVMIFPAWTFWSVYKESTFKNDAKRFIEKEFDALPNAGFIKKYASYTYNKSDISSIDITPFGNDKISEETMNVLRARLQDYSALQGVRLTLPFQRNDDGDDYKDEVRYMAELRSRDSLDILNKDQKIIYLEQKVLQLSKLEEALIPFSEICEEAKIQYENLKALSYSRTYMSNLENIDTLTVFDAVWKDSIADDVLTKDKERLYKWLDFKLKLDTLIVR
ncbi:DUF389 domain-containing protein [uncultured Dokdonia sp.]|uniref:DUF389 domain-containing protein n=1 Tax=uncultured Dokdonia sp. TaxID=575653 RepID=UPI00262E9CD8|nr:DUF389 domain-containing protein [uncultured Dokdonia sp.]